MVTELKEDNVQNAYKNGTEQEKKFLENLFPDMFSKKKINERVKTFEDALGIVMPEVVDPNVKILLDYNGINKDILSAQAQLKLSIIARALNEGWQPDWIDDDEYKYYPYFEYKAGFGFSHTGYDSWGARTNVGSRLCFKSRELAEYAGKQFEKLYNQLFTL